MLGQKPRVFKTHTTLSLEGLVPTDHFYRDVEAKLDLSFVRGLVQEYYSPVGRPSIDPVVFFKLQLIMFFEGMCSERQLMEAVKVNLAHRWYLGYDLDEPVPDHSALSKIRDRYGLDLFQQFFEAIVERCIEAGLVWGKELHFDGTKVRANADKDQQVPRFYWEARQHLQALFRSPTIQVAPRGFTEKYSGERLVGQRTNITQERQADLLVCSTDPDATPLYSQPGHSRLGYNLQYVVDGGKARIILAALVMPASIQDNTPMLDLERWVRFRWRLHPRCAVADTKYGSLSNIVGLEQDGLYAYVGLPDHRTRTQTFSYEHFQYDAQRDGYICPAGQFLGRSSYDQLSESHLYRTSTKVCAACPHKSQCTTSSYARIVKRSVYQAFLDRVRYYHTTSDYLKAQRKRAVWIEPMFGEAKQWHQLVQFRLRRLHKVNIQALMVAAGQNIKRLLKAHQYTKPHRPIPALAQAASPRHLFLVSLFAPLFHNPALAPLLPLPCFSP